MSAAAGPTNRALRFLVHDTDEERGSLIALRARAGGHVVALETGMDGVRHRLLTEHWDALAMEVLAGRVSSPFAVRDLASAVRRHGGSMPPAVIYVRDTLLVRQATIDALLDELVPTLERVHGQDPDRVIRAMERAASGRRPAVVAIRPDAAAPSGSPPRPAVAQPASAAVSSPASPSPASNWRR
jgi:hypothetical protein